MCFFLSESSFVALLEALFLDLQAFNPLPFELLHRVIHIPPFVLEVILHFELVGKQLFFDPSGCRKASPEESERDVISNRELVIQEAKSQMSSIFGVNIHEEAVQYFLLKLFLDSRHKIDRYFEEFLRYPGNTEKVLAFRHKHHLTIN